ncbi:unnamed protein product [Cylicocyclus nassatus]|uniref:7TM GPCR serpentine receptor class x (Srx) domain-containing protein n=1 Tax=Cylicocyclus nassatus TaxID=53992 RepID=A0AA36H693_CYLNA|nr:unnamed protein product [Cylicocyclus nassatus]
MDSVIAGTITIALGIFGCIINIVAIVQTLKEASLQKEFGYLCVSKLTANVGTLSLNTMWSGPAMLFHLDVNTTSSFVGARFVVSSQLLFLFDTETCTRGVNMWYTLAAPGFWLSFSRQFISEELMRTRTTYFARQLIVLKKNVRLYVQGCLMAGCFAVIVVSFHVLAPQASSKWKVFVFTLCIEEIANTVVGLVILFFNRSLTFRICT